MSPFIGHPPVATAASLVDDGPVRLLTLTGELTADTVDEVRPVLDAAGGAGRPVVADLSEVRCLDSRGLLALLVLRERLHEQALGMAVVCHPDSLVATIIRLSGVHELIAVRTTRRAARSAARRPRRPGARFGGRRP